VSTLVFLTLSIWPGWSR